MLTPEQLPEWWTQSAVFEFLNARGRHYWVGYWNHLLALVVVVATTRQTAMAAASHPRRPAPNQVNPRLVGWTVLFAQLIWFMFGWLLLDRGYSFYYGSAFWGVIAIGYACLMWAWRIRIRRDRTQSRGLPAHATWSSS
jgi:hypothetical protein